MSPNAMRAFMVALGVKDAGSHMVGTRLADHPTWSRVYIERIREAIRNNYQSRNIEHVVHGPYGLDRVLLISMVGIIENGHVLRFWGHRPGRHGDARSGKRIGATRCAAARAGHRDHAGRGTRAPQARKRAARRPGAEPHRQ
jgi:hypothetical protein